MISNITKKYFTIALLVLPILNVYQFPTRFVPLGDFLIILILPLIFTDLTKNPKVILFGRFYDIKKTSRTMQDFYLSVIEN